jgi:hypothetical protein
MGITKITCPVEATAEGKGDTSVDWGKNFA